MAFYMGGSNVMSLIICLVNTTPVLFSPLPGEIKHKVFIKLQYAHALSYVYLASYVQYAATTRLAINMQP